MVEAPEHRRTSSLHNVTNTLIVTKVPPSLLHSSVTPSLKEFFARHGNIEAWVPLSSFERVVVVYSTVEAAERAKEGMDWTLVEGFGSTSSNTSSTLRVYRGQYTPLETLRNRRLRQHLPVPESNRNFLISPPGSPPVGWEQIREDPPNMETLARDLATALENLTTHSPYDHDDQDGSDDSDGGHGSACGHSESDSPRLATPRDTLIIPHQRSPSGDLPSVLVSDTDYCDGVCSPTSRNGLSISQAFSLQRRTPSPRPPSRISQVKATVESMQSCYQFPPKAPRIDRTARPPLAS